MIRLGRIDHVCLRVRDLDEAAARWSLQLGLVERSREAIRGCLQANAAKLSESCRLAAGRQGKGGSAGAREADARKPDGSTPQ